MFILPPPPTRNIHNSIYGAGTAGGPPIETANKLSQPTGPEHELVVGEGTYVLKDSLLLATPPPHPSEAPQPNSNPLAITTGSPIGGTRLSIPILSSRRQPTHSVFRSALTYGHDSRLAIPSIQEEGQNGKSDADSAFGSASYYRQAPAFGDGNPALIPAPVKGRKDQRAKPKNNIIKSNSSFVSRVIPHESLTKKLADRSLDGLYAFANINRAFLWLDLSSEAKTENLTKVLFTRAHVLCHDINVLTKSTTHLDIIMGCNSSDVIWYEPMTQKYTRLNKNGMINSAATRSILWLPHKENLFVAAHDDGTLYVYDKEKEDAAFVVDETAETRQNGSTDGKNGDTTDSGESQHLSFHVLKSVESRDQKANPVAAWRMSNMKINNMAFSPDGELLAIVCDDGTLTIFDYIRERVLDVYRSYYGALLCVTWSPDGRYILTGGQDDLVSIWSLPERGLVARGVGHHSWVTDVRFDAWRCDDRTYRFGSVGQDCHLLLWDFSVGMLGRPRALSARHRSGSTVAGAPGVTSTGRKESLSTVHRIRSNSARSGGVHSDEADAEPAKADGNMVHDVDSRASTAVLPPIMAKSVDEHPLCWLGFEEHCILASCTEGHILEFDRPEEGGGGGGTGGEKARS